MRAHGFEPEDYAHESIDIWPENEQAMALFSKVGTRWNSGFSGVTGLRFEAIYPLMDRMNLAPEAWDVLLSDLEVMEHAAMAVINRPTK